MAITFNRLKHSIDVTDDGVTENPDLAVTGDPAGASVPPETYDADYLTTDTDDYLTDICQHSRRVSVLMATRQHGVTPSGYAMIQSSKLFHGGIMDNVGVEDLADTDALTSAIISFLEQEVFSEEDMIRKMLVSLTKDIPELTEANVTDVDKQLQDVVTTFQKVANKPHPDITKYLGIHPQQLAYRASLLRRLAVACQTFVTTIPLQNAANSQAVGNWITTFKTSILGIIGNDLVSDNVPPLPIMHDHAVIDWIQFRPFAPVTTSLVPLPSTAVATSICNEVCNATAPLQKSITTIVDHFKRMSAEYKVDAQTTDMFRPDQELQMLALCYHVLSRVIAVWYKPSVTMITYSFTAMTQVLSAKD